MTKLVIGCVALTVVLMAAVLVFFVTAEPERPPLFTTLTSAIENGAEILDADQHGAITLTATGKIRGFTRDGVKVWERSFERYEPNNGLLLGASASCADKCPSGFITTPSGYESVGWADPSGSITRTLNDQALLLLEPISASSVFASAAAGSASAASGNVTALRSVISTDQSPSDAPTLGEIPIPGPRYIGLSGSGNRAVVGSINGNPPNQNALIRALRLTSDGWQPYGPSIPTVASVNTCISPDGELIGIAGTRLQIAKFGRRPFGDFGPRVSESVCTITNTSIVAATSAVDPADGVSVVSYLFTGGQLWRRPLGNVRVLSSADALNIVVRSEATGEVTAIESKLGKTVLKRKLPANVFAADDGAIVIADRPGKPEWIKIASALEP